jgi:hypothetical protein
MLSSKKAADDFIVRVELEQHQNKEARANSFGSSVGLNGSILDFHTHAHSDVFASKL